ncbi:histone acetyltransferase MCC1-like isoform X1 [Primulina tabacum]|uniref:histone acetyltransferase MCC1-like isoform X1 n=1 Tax=Primulina tabacum TaxID=48773 RepID=UPI003F59E8AE
MVNLKVPCHPSISFRPIQPPDLAVLEIIHGDLFPVRYESEFFHNIVNGRDIVSWGAVDQSRSNPQNDELIGFVTARVVLAKESEVEDLLSFDSPNSDQTLVYILTLGVLESYRNMGVGKFLLFFLDVLFWILLSSSVLKIQFLNRVFSDPGFSASSLMHEVVKFASSISTCRAVYLHVISYNIPAIHLYKKMSFQCLRRLYNFYYINGEHYDSYLFVYYVNGGRSPCSPLELVLLFVSYIKGGFKSIAAKLWKNEEKKKFKWPKFKESSCLLPTVQNKSIATSESARSVPACGIS